MAFKGDQGARHRPITSQQNRAAFIIDCSPCAHCVNPIAADWGLPSGAITPFPPTGTWRPGTADGRLGTPRVASDVTAANSRVVCGPCMPMLSLA